MYFGDDFDNDGTRLNGLNAYSGTFSRGSLPAGERFLVIHAVQPAAFLPALNELDRYSLGTKNLNEAN
ncbi:DUF1214 domain-containing protein [Roseiconus nitratireducens]|uniref:DUF1214 domain-containing protein n=1 Tax=Roseiconus nitratireducens TaxID=2605748 RepID=A0A5M6D9X1_9BACT|nr:DUF1214 domain-containing protein [Roseiconus nitratireducens]